MDSVAKKVEKVRRSYSVLRENHLVAIDEIVENRLQRVMDESLWPQIESREILADKLGGHGKIPPTRLWAASPDFLLLLVEHIQNSAAERIVECGGGASTIVLAEALRASGRKGSIKSIENHPRFCRLLKDEIDKRGLGEWVEVICAPLVERCYEGFPDPFYWYDLDVKQDIGAVDMVVVDGPFGKLREFARYPAGPEFLPLLREGGRVFLDDAKRKDERRLPRLWRDNYPDLGVRAHRTEKGALEVFRLEEVVKEYLR